MSTDLYRFFGDSGRLIYVGITDNLKSRTVDHMGKSWWSEVTSMTVRKYGARADAMAAEAASIRDEHPAYNVQGQRKGHHAPLPISPDQTFEDIASAARRLGVCTKSVRRYIADGRLTAYRVGPRLIRLNPNEVDRLMRLVPTVALLS